VGGGAPAPGPPANAAPGPCGGEWGGAIAPAAIRFGMVGTVVMPTVGTFNFSTPGGIASPQLSDAIAPLVGDLPGWRAQSHGTATGPTSFCGSPSTCNAEIHFSVIAPGKVGVAYFIGNGNNFGSGGAPIGGVATFAQAAGFTQQSGSALVSFADPTNAVLAIGDASGTIAIGGTFTTLDEVHLASGKVRIRGTASSVDVGGIPGIIGWERW